MDLQLYYRNIRELAETIKDEFPVVVSRETQDGGKEGVFTEVASRLAAKMVVDGKARLAEAGEATAFRKQQADAKRRAEQESAAAKVQFAVLSTEDLSRLKGVKGSKE
ncbi:MAG TPA: hypothetical protein VKU19_25745 [Bryobacteraceae bacterium]|nr:hypothetical protein [Bryobacteraceae bacterium]